MPKVIIDSESTSLQERFAVIRAPRRNRQRFPEACVEVVKGAEEALAGADPGRHLHAALVYGPSVSSESQRIYYLVRWLAPE
jgi:hypothetical protein